MGKASSNMEMCLHSLEFDGNHFWPLRSSRHSAAPSILLAFRHGTGRLGSAWWLDQAVIGYSKSRVQGQTRVWHGWAHCNLGYTGNISQVTTRPLTNEMPSMGGEQKTWEDRAKSAMWRTETRTSSTASKAKEDAGSNVDQQDAETKGCDAFQSIQASGPHVQS